MTSAAALALLLAAGAGAGEIVATVVDQKDQPVAGAVVFVYEVPGGRFAPPERPAVVDQVDKEFNPHVLAVLAGTKVTFSNKDTVQHQIYSFSKAKRFEIPLFKDEAGDPVVLDKPGIVKLGCNIHDWMLGYILVLDNPYFAMTGPDGAARLKVPAGSWELAAWSERMKGDGEVDKSRQKVSAGAKPVRASLKIKASAARKPARPAVKDY